MFRGYTCRKVLFEVYTNLQKKLEAIAILCRRNQLIGMKTFITEALGPIRSYAGNLSHLRKRKITFLLQIKTTIALRITTYIDMRKWI